MPKGRFHAEIGRPAETDLGKRGALLELSAWIRPLRSPQGVEHQGRARFGRCDGVLATSTGAVARPAPPRLLTRVRTLRAVDAAAIAVFATIGGVALRPVRDPDAFWHVATGRLIWRTHKVPKADSFSWTAPGRHWIAHEWLTETIFWPIQRTLGWAGLTMFCALAILATWMLVWSTARLLGASPWAAVGLTALGATSSTHTWDARPQMISLACMALLGRLMADAWMGSPKRLLWAVPLILVWANLHGGYIFGIALLGAFATGVTLDRVLGIRRTSSEAATPALVRKVWIVTLLAAASSLLNPNGLRGFLYPFSYLGDNASTRYVAEWMAPRFSNPDYWPFAVLLALTIAGMWRARRIVPAHVVICTLAFGGLGLQSVRNISQFAVFCAPWAAWALTRTRTRSQPATAPAAHDPAKATVHLVVALGACAAWAVLAFPNLTASANAAEQRATYPVAATRSLAQHATPNTRIFNQYDWGGYLTLELPSVPVFVDGRPDMYGDAFIDRYMSIWLLRPGWQSRLSSTGVTTVLASTSSPMVLALRADRGWTATYTDRVATILERR